MDTAKAILPNKSSRAPKQEELLNCEFCPRLFQHRRNVLLHSSVCKKVEEQIQEFREYVDSLENSVVSGGAAKPFPKMLDTKLLASWERMQKKIECHYCIRTFPTPNQLSSHERVHTGVRPYACHVCGHKFSHSSNMIKHIKCQHSSFNPYACYNCNKNFKTKTEVLDHRQRCDERKERFSSAKKSMKGGSEDEDEAMSEDENVVET